MTLRKLTPRQARFVAEYLVDDNATQAAARAGYSAKNAGKLGSALLGNARIAEAIRAARRSRETRTEVTADRVIEELALIAFSDVGDILDFAGEEPHLKPAYRISPRARRAISSVKVKRYVEGHGDDARTVEVTEFKFWSKEAALEKLGRRLKLWSGDEDAPKDLTEFFKVLSGNGKLSEHGSGETPRVYDA